MKLIITRGNLKEGLGAVERATGENLNLPILKNILVKTDQNRIKITATNLEVGINYFILGKVIEDGSITVPASVFINLINNLQSERLSLETKKNNLGVKTDNYEAVIQGMPAEEFPLIPKIKNEEEFIEIKGDLLKEALTQIILSAQISDLRPELNSVLLCFSLEDLKLAATDSFRLSEKTIIMSQFKTNHTESFKLLLPIKTIQELLHILKDDDALKIYHDPNQVLFKTNDFELISRLVEGNFPNYEAIIPKKFDTEVILNRQELMNALKVAGIFSSRTSEVKLKVPENKKTLEVSSGEQSIGENNCVLPAKIQGNHQELNFNWRYLLDGLKTLKTEDVYLGLNEDNKPAIIKAINDASYFYIIMPILKT